MRSPAFVLVSLLSAGCASSSATPAPRSVLAVRAPQTRSYDQADRHAVFTAMMQGLEDAGFQLAQVNAEAGFVSANAENVHGREAPQAVKAVLWPYALMFPGLFGHKRHTIMEITGTIEGEGAGQRVRLACRTKVLDSAGTVQKLQEVEDPKFYQDLFARIDKALFLVHEGI